MKAKLLDSIVTTEYQFEVEIETVKYSVKIWLNQKGKFVDETISFPNGDELNHEGEQGDIREKIIAFLDQNWDSLVK